MLAWVVEFGLEPLLLAALRARSVCALGRCVPTPSTAYSTQHASVDGPLPHLCTLGFDTSFYVHPLSGSLAMLEINGDKLKTPMP